ncbi:unnamed protein product [Diatraea saccharalis]|uniref:Ubiquitin-like protease family profile domain-containing protein n=1 Tax=Diatraea saccharalis TaxID=40085 RepID=A0A9N9WF40_9NEOP|nr:unnamed protein product [Diatraea saccharalis]
MISKIFFTNEALANAITAEIGMSNFFSIAHQLNDLLKYSYKSEHGFWSNIVKRIFPSIRLQSTMLKRRRQCYYRLRKYFKPIQSIISSQISPRLNGSCVVLENSNENDKNSLDNQLLCTEPLTGPNPNELYSPCLTINHNNNEDIPVFNSNESFSISKDNSSVSDCRNCSFSKTNDEELSVFSKNSMTVDHMPVINNDALSSFTGSNNSIYQCDNYHLLLNKNRIELSSPVVQKKLNTTNDNFEELNISAYNKIETSINNIEPPEFCVNRCSSTENEVNTDHNGIASTPLILSAIFWKKYWTGGISLKKGWTDEFNDEFNKIYQACVLSFKWHKCKEISKKSNVFFQAVANCKHTTCVDNFTFISNQPIKPFRDLQIQVFRDKPIYHDNEVHRRFIKGCRREIIKKELKTLWPIEKKFSMLNEVTDDILGSGNMNNALTLSLLQKMSSEERWSSKLSKKFTDALVQLEEKFEQEWKGKFLNNFIQNVSLKPFFVILFTEKQLRILLNEKDRTFCYLDATGSLIKKPKDDCKRIFYYSLILRGDEKNERSPFPVAEFISAAHSVPYITFFLSTVCLVLKKLSSRSPIINKIETDFSMALLQATSQAVNKLALIEYVNTIFNKFTRIQSMTILHICSSHMIKTFSRKIKTFGIKRKSKVYEVSMRLAANLIHCQSKEQAGEIFKTVIMLFSTFLCKEKLADFLDKIMSDESFDHSLLEDKHTNQNIDDASVINVNDYDSDEENKDFENNFQKDSLYYKYFEQIYNSICDTADKKEEINEYYYPEIVKYILNKWLPLFPLWSAVLIQQCDILRDSNAAVENWHKIMKSYIYGREQNMAIQRFIHRQAELLTARIRDRKFSLKTERQKNNVKKQIDERSEEKWKGKETSKRGKNFHFYQSRLPNKKIKRDLSKYSQNTEKVPSPESDSDSSNSNNERSTYYDKTPTSSNKDMNDAIDNKPDLQKQNMNEDVVKLSSSLDQKMSVNFDNQPICQNEEINNNSKKLLIPQNHEINVKFNQSFDSKLPQNNEDVDELKNYFFSPSNNYPENFPNIRNNVNKYVIEPNDFFTLHKHKWLSDNIINGFASIYANKAVKENKNIMFVDTLSTSGILHRNVSRGFNKWLVDNEFAKYNIWLLPFNLNAMHWVLVVVDFERQNIVLIDSAHNCLQHDEITAILEWLTSTHKYQNTNKDWKFYAPKDIPNQRDGYSCGVHVCLWIYVICTGIPLSFDEIDARKARARIATHLAETTQVEPRINHERITEEMLKNMIYSTGKAIAINIPKEEEDSYEGKWRRLSNKKSINKKFMKLKKDNKNLKTMEDDDVGIRAKVSIRILITIATFIKKEKNKNIQ